jgi:hypothetical protein
LFGSAGALAADQTWTGRITDSMCGADHSMMEHGGKKLTARDCTLACVKSGSKYALIANGKVYEIENSDLKELEEHAGHIVKVTGELSSDGKTIKATKVTIPQGKKS